MKLYNPFPKANHECKEGKQREKSNMKNSRGQQLLNTFGALPRAQFMHTICCFEAREVINPTLQTVHESELKWRSYSHWKLITPSWRPISQAAKSQGDGYEISLWLWNGVLQVAKFRSHLARLRNSPECFQIFATNIFRFFASDIWCLNPHFLLVTHQLYDSLVIK